MYSQHKGTTALNIFGWNWHVESSLTTGLLNDVPSEIELSEYGRFPSPESESPSGLLYEESLKEEPIADLDLFFERIYSYYCEKGLSCIIVKWIVELLCLAFTICFSAFFFLFVDWNGLRNAKCGIDAVESGIGPCDLAKEALHQHPLTPLTLLKAVIIGYLGLFSIYWIFCFLRFFAQLRYTLRIRHFYYNSLHVTDNELQTIPWAVVLEKLVQVQNMQQQCVVKDLTANDVMMRLMRKENYLIGMINKGVLAIPISKWVPGAGPMVKIGPNGRHHHLILTKTLEWTLNWSILQSMFDRNFCIRADFMSNPKSLKKRLVVVGLVMLLLSPFWAIFLLIYLFLRHGEQFYNHPTIPSSRRWSNLSKWMFREFNEVEHLFRYRINNSAVHASDYLKQFPAPIVSILAKFISFIAGGLAGVLIIIALLDESLLEGHVFGRNLFWYAAVFGAITALSRSAITDAPLVLEPERAMTMVVQHTHHLPKRWRGKENTAMVRMEFETLYQYTAMMWLEEMASIFLTPYLLIFVLPKMVEDILQFIADFTVNVEGVGDVCSFSAFNFQKHGNNKYASPFDSSRAQRSSQGKMEKSFLSFHCSYPFREPDMHGTQFLTSLRTFRDQQLRGPFMGYEFPRPQIWCWSSNLRDPGIRNSYFTSGPPQNHGDRWGSLWLIETDQRTHPYLLDLYYTYRSSLACRNSGDIPASTLDIPDEQPQELQDQSLPNAGCHEEGIWGNLFEDRTQSHCEASTSDLFLQERSMLQQHGSGNAMHLGKNRWWARTGAQGPEAPEASFLEPPDFNQHGADILCDHHSVQSAEEGEVELDWRGGNRLSQTTSPDEWLSWTTGPGHRVFGKGGAPELFFEDVYKPP